LVLPQPSGQVILATSSAAAQSQALDFYPNKLVPEQEQSGAAVNVLAVVASHAVQAPAAE